MSGRPRFEQREPQVLSGRVYDSVYRGEPARLDASKAKNVLVGRASTPTRDGVMLTKHGTYGPVV
jgi:hypothetical protein